MKQLRRGFKYETGFTIPRGVALFNLPDADSLDEEHAEG